MKKKKKHLDQYYKLCQANVLSVFDTKLEYFCVLNLRIKYGFQTLTFRTLWP